MLQAASATLLEMWSWIIAGVRPAISQRLTMRTPRSRCAHGTTSAVVTRHSRSHSRCSRHSRLSSLSSIACTLLPVTLLQSFRRRLISCCVQRRCRSKSAFLNVWSVQWKCMHLASQSVTGIAPMLYSKCLKVCCNRSTMSFPVSFLTLDQVLYLEFNMVFDSICLRDLRRSTIIIQSSHTLPTYSKPCEVSSLFISRIRVVIRQ
jgi:hypothetical protein